MQFYHDPAEKLGIKRPLLGAVSQIPAGSGLNGDAV